MAVTVASTALAEEGGTGHHLPGSGVSLTAMLAEAGFTIAGSNWLYFGRCQRVALRRFPDPRQRGQKQQSPASGVNAHFPSNTKPT